jgi:vesicle-associated membrane protein 72
MASPSPQQGAPRLIYALIARDGPAAGAAAPAADASAAAPSSAATPLVLADAAAPGVSGNFAAICAEVLGSPAVRGNASSPPGALPSSSSSASQQQDRFTVASGGYTLNFLRRSGFVLGAVAPEQHGRAVPFAFLDRAADAFLAGPHVPRALSASSAYALDRQLSPLLQQELRYCDAHAPELDRVAAVRSRVDEVRQVMVQNVEAVLARGERLDVMVDKTEALASTARDFQRQGTALRRRMWWREKKMWALVALIVVLGALVIFLLACFSNGRNCIKPKEAQQQGGAPPGSLGR